MSEKKYANVGGQAVIEGIMMKSPLSTVLAVRRPDGEIEIRPLAGSDSKRPAVAKWPLIRGLVSFVSSLSVGYKALMLSAEIAGVEEPKDEKDDKKNNKLMTSLLLGLSAVLGVALAIGLFVFIPTLVTELIQYIAKIPDLGAWKALIQGIIRIIIVLIYVAAVSLMKDIRRLFQYHGAEHKTIFCFESREELTVENVRKQSRFHPRCGTSFLLIVLIISIVFFSCLSLIPGFSYLNEHLPYVFMIVKLLFLPIVAGISFEILRFCGRHDNWLTRILSAPGLAFQRLTTAEPDDSQIEVGIAALKESLKNPDTGEPDYEAAYRKKT